jgi:hypothetical protein
MLRPLSLANIKLLIWVFWGLGAWASSNLLIYYEQIMNYGSQAKLSLTQVFLTGAPQIRLDKAEFNLANEGPIGYGIMALMLFCLFMCAKELLAYPKFLRSLANGENSLGGGEKEI